MKALKWLGYILVAILLLTVIIGVVMFLSALAMFGGAVICVVGLVWAVAHIIKGLIEAPCG